MPVSSVSGMNSWGLYLVSAVALVLVLTPQLSGLARASREAADWRFLDGVRAVADSLQPGVVVNLTFSSPLAPDPLQLGAHRLSSDYGGGTISLPSRWALPNATLYPSLHYLLWLSGSRVMVTQTG